MKNILVTGGTVFVSRYVAEYYVRRGDHVFVLNRNSRPQSEGVTLIEADRHHLGEQLRKYHFDVVLDITAYNGDDVSLLLDALGSYDTYILLSSSAVYPENSPQPFEEKTPLGANIFWGRYGTDKICAEQTLLQRDSKAYIIRPPYLYGPMNNVYREAFVFDCALQDRKFYLPKRGELNLQFFYINDLCRFMDCLLEQKPEQRIFNVGNRESISVRDWVTLCYQVVGKSVEFVHVTRGIEQRNYFSFYDYEYCLDIKGQERLMPETTSVEKGLEASLAWYLQHPEAVNRKPLIEYIDANLI